MAVLCSIVWAVYRLKKAEESGDERPQLPATWRISPSILFATRTAYVKNLIRKIFSTSNLFIPMSD